jgi:hypothetical protein
LNSNFKILNPSGFNRTVALPHRSGKKVTAVTGAVTVGKKTLVWGPVDSRFSMMSDWQQPFDLVLQVQNAAWFVLLHVKNKRERY